MSFSDDLFSGTSASASLWTQIGGSVISGLGAYSSAKEGRYRAMAQAAGAESNAVMADINARLAELQAQSILDAGQREAGRLTMRAGQVMGAQRAAIAANGIDLGSGSAAEVLATTDFMKDTDRYAIEANAIRSAWGHRTQAMNEGFRAAAYRSDAAIYRANAKGSNPGAALATSLLGSAGDVASSWYKLAKSGAFDTRNQSAGNYQIGTPGFSGNYLHFDP